jgi:hypothetical protein
MTDSENRPVSIFKDEDLREKDEHMKLADLVKTRKLIV